MSSKNDDTLFSSYLDSVGRMSSSGNTAKAYKIGLGHFRKFTEEKYQCTVKEIIPGIKNGDPDVYKTLDGFVGYLHKLKKKPTSVRLYTNSVRGFLRHEGIKTYSEDFRQTVKLPKKIVHREEPLTKEIIVRLLRTVPLKLQAIILVSTSTGMRIGELVQLKISDIDFESKPTKVNIRAETTKTKVSRIAFLTGEATKALKDYLTRYFEWEEDKSNHSIQNRTIFGRTSKNTNGDFIESASYHNAVSVLLLSLKRYIARIPELSKLNENGRSMIHFHAFRKYCRTALGDVVGRDMAETMIGHRFYLDTYYRSSEAKLKEAFLKAEPYLTISDHVQVEKNQIKIMEKQKQLEEDQLILKQHIDKYFVSIPDFKKKETIQEKEGKLEYDVECPICGEFIGETVTLEEAESLLDEHQKKKHPSRRMITESIM